jgi:bacterioferritin (cytochrome b1)
MKSATDMGMNRTGIGISPVHSKELIEGAQAGAPSSVGDEGNLLAMRTLYMQDAEPVGTVPPPATLMGAAQAVASVLKGQKLGVLLDKLGERLAFERTGCRLYEGIIGKALAGGMGAGGPTLEELQRFHDDELRHVDMLRRIVEGLGGDPTVQTPSADIAGVESMGIVQVIADPRMTLAQSLHAILVAELADNDGYSALIQLAQSLGQGEIADKLRAARLDEDRHLEHVRVWVTNHAVAEGAKEIDTQA